jgi:hypothetical protein
MDPSLVLEAGQTSPHHNQQDLQLSGQYPAGWGLNSLWQCRFKKGLSNVKLRPTLTDAKPIVAGGGRPFFHVCPDLRPHEGALGASRIRGRSATFSSRYLSV